MIIIVGVLIVFGSVLGGFMMAGGNLASLWHISEFVIIGGAMGDTVLDQAGVKAVAAMPSRDELIAQIVSCIGAPASAIAGAIGAPASNIASILSTIEENAAA